MFPFTYNSKQSYKAEGVTDSDLKEIIAALKLQLDDCEATGTNKFSFSNFKIIFKRFRWLSGGEMSFALQPNSIDVKLELNFAGMGVVLVLFTIAILAIQRLGVVIESIEIGIVTLFMLILYAFTVQVYKSSIGNTIGRVMYRRKEWQGQ